MVKYRGVYASYMMQFISFKRSLGYKFRAEYTYLLFDRFTIKEQVSTVGLTKELADKWGQLRANESSQTRYHRVALVGQLSVYLNGLGIKSYIPRLPKLHCTYTPYIFSEDEIKSFFVSCDRIQIGCKQFDTCVSIVPTLFRLLYATGIRLCEALSLHDKDINLEDNYLIIKTSKNGKDRIIPLSESVSQTCKEYKEYRDRHFGRSDNDYFLITHIGRPCPRRTAYNWFRRILLDAGISHGGRGQGPRIHDLRHTFSVHSFATMAKAGLDLYYSLPILSTYLGHQSLEATEKYVRLTSEMYPDLLHDVNDICKYVFPKIKCYEAN
jgi:integrase/recombinase XerD